MAGVALEELLGVGRDAVRRQHAAEAGGDARLPVDERAVAVERQRLELGEVDRRPTQRVGGGMRISSPARIVVGSPICGFMSRTVSYGTPNQLTMLTKLSPERTV